MRTNSILNTSTIVVLAGLLILGSGQVLVGQDADNLDEYTLNIVSADGEQIKIIEEETLVRVTFENKESIRGYLGFRNDSLILVDSIEVRLADIAKIQYNNRKKLISGSILTVSGPLLFLTTAFLASPGSSLILASAIIYPAIFLAGVAILISNNIAYRIGEKWAMSVQPQSQVLLLPDELPAIQIPAENIQ
ncbi:hypothetical protein ACFLTU_09030 [Bacteroidota bacterium]